MGKKQRNVKYSEDVDKRLMTLYEYQRERMDKELNIHLTFTQFMERMAKKALSFYESKMTQNEELSSFK